MKWICSYLFWFTFCVFVRIALSWMRIDVSLAQWLGVLGLSIVGVVLYELDRAVRKTIDAGQRSGLRE